ncbi:zf-TFIIB domain-containing protein [Xanthobacter sp. VNH20]|uniref:TFIIB-type zinc ribbon-containing protein n=1 Tax=Xanthobacter TaxID=279 RepID=UPI0032B431DF
MTDTSIQGLLCPVCRISLVMSERQNIEIDYCPQCRGVWLDRGELDKIIERSTSKNAPTPPPSDGPRGQGGSPDTGGSSQRDWSGYGSGHGEAEHRSWGKHQSHGGRGRGFLGKLFD